MGRPPGIPPVRLWPKQEGKRLLSFQGALGDDDPRTALRDAARHPQRAAQPFAQQSEIRDGAQGLEEHALSGYPCDRSAPRKTRSLTACPFFQVLPTRTADVPWWARAPF